MTQLTFQVDEAVLARARAVAAARNMTLEQMLGVLLRVVTERDELSRLGPKARAAVGLLKGLPDSSFEDLLSDALVEKYGSQS